MSDDLSCREINVLVVEDNPVDARMIRYALEGAGLKKPPTVLDDGLPALALLRGDKEFEQYPFPDLLILDLNLRRIDGPEVLAYVRATASLSKLCVVVLSSSPTYEMQQRAARADAYFTKPTDLDGFKSLGSRLLNCFSASKRLPDS